ncbi:hypothetical protein TRVA0_022S00606 [Trichomonascus vanleenenianus]|uniref:Htc1p n=1 Tax=Trichomonascus vanleenenianus TaxID=2268995 RepID=UPI003ECAC645
MTAKTTVVTATATAITAKSVDSKFVIEEERDRRIIELGDGNFVPFTWADLQQIISSMDLAKLSRRPSDLKYYLECKHRYRLEYGGVLPYIVLEKLRWASSSTEIDTIMPANEECLEEESDVKILFNDFPYGVEPHIKHMVVWSKSPIPADEEGKLTPEAFDKIDSYVKRTFIDNLGMKREDVLWFKNWKALQSVRALEHFHVLLNNPPMDKVGALVDGPGILH